MTRPIFQLGVAQPQQGAVDAHPPPTFQRWRDCCKLPATGDKQENVVKTVQWPFSSASLGGNCASITNVIPQTEYKEAETCDNACAICAPFPSFCQGHKPKSLQDSSKRVDEEKQTVGNCRPKGFQFLKKGWKSGLFVETNLRFENAGP